MEGPHPGRGAPLMTDSADLASGKGHKDENFPVASALIAARVIRGESPAAFPYRGISKTRLLVNPQAAAAAGLRIPADVLRRAEPWGQTPSRQAVGPVVRM